MNLNYNVTGPERKKLVQLISEIAECEPKYLGAPSFSYQVDYFTIDKNGCVSFDDMADSEIIEQLIERLYENGFVAEGADPDKQCISIALPRELFNEAAISNLSNILKSKGSLIKKALKLSELPVFYEKDKVSFPWFPADSSPEELNAYEEFVCKLCEMVRSQNRVSSKETETENEKYAFRCFLLRLGFIGDEFKSSRKILLRNLSGSSAFKVSRSKGGNNE